MNALRKIIAAAVAAVTLSTAALETTPSSAYILLGPGGHGGFHWHYRFSDRYRYGWHRWGYDFGGYRPVVVVVAPAVCPAGTHLGYLGKHCWPNR